MHMHACQERSHGIRPGQGGRCRWSGAPHWRIGRTVDQRTGEVWQTRFLSVKGPASLLERQACWRAIYVDIGPRGRAAAAGRRRCPWPPPPRSPAPPSPPSPALVDRYEHSLQTATRALRAGECEEIVVAALLHDIGDILAPLNHAAIAAEILKPFVSRQVHWMLEKQVQPHLFGQV